MSTKARPLKQATATGARSWLATTGTGRRFGFSATSKDDAWKRAFHETRNGAEEVGLTVRPYLTLETR